MSFLAPLADLPPAPPAPPHDSQADSPRKLLKGRSASRRPDTTIAAKYKLAQVLGSGVHGQVRKAAVQGQPKDFFVAVKAVQMEDSEGKALARVRQEVAAHIACHHHPNIPTCFDLVHTPSASFVVMEYAADGDLFEIVTDHGPLMAASAARVLRQLACAVTFMHANNIAHCDIKPENVLLTDNTTRALLCDFGHAVEWTEEAGLLSKKCGTVRCLAPETLVAADAQGAAPRYDPRKLDVFALGNVLFFMLTGRFPFEGASTSETAQNIVTGRLTTQLPRRLPPQCVDLLRRLLATDPSLRPSARQVLAHPFLAPKRARSQVHSS